MNDAKKGGPPADMPATELWATITQLPRPFRVVDFPRRDPLGTAVGQIAIWVLTQEEQEACAAAAERMCKQLLKEASEQTNGLGYQDLYRNEATVQVLYRACRDVKDIKRSAFPSPGEMRKHFTVDEIGVLVRMYYQVQSEVGPIVAGFSSEEEEDEWIRRLAQGGEAFPTASLSPELADRLLISMASRLASSSTDTSSLGSQPDESQPDAGNDDEIEPLSDGA